MDVAHIEIRHSLEKGRALFALKAFTEGETIFEETPIVSSQFAWNEDYGYLACELCLRPLESALENVKRLTDNEISDLPYPEMCKVDKSQHVHCSHCGVRYCSPECQTLAWNCYHKTLCFQKTERDGSHPLELIKEIWKQMHYPPETTSIMLFVKIFAIIHQSEDKNTIINKFQQFCHKVVNENENITHKLLGLKFIEQVEALREAIVRFCPVTAVQEWVSKEGFLLLMALVGMNGQGIGTSSFGEWVKNVTSLDLSPDEKRMLNQYIEKIYENFEKGVGDFLNNEGSGLYLIQSSINHSCKPNAEVTFPNSNYQLAVRATENISPGEEICISYLDECVLERSRHSRQKVLQENYLFTCKCEKCEEEIHQLDETSSEESEISDN